jgi:CheY-like chemotaxis protein
MSRRILIIDDNDQIRDAYALLLRGRGYEIACASGGKEGLRQVADAKPDLIILDMVMPDLNGLTFLDQLPLACTQPLPPVIANSGLDDFAGVAMQKGATVFLPKPVDGAKLLDTVHALLVVARDGLAA